MTRERMAQLRENHAAITANIAAAMERRAPDMARPVTLLAATKHVCAEDIAFAVRELGVSAVGENRVGELTEKLADPLEPYRGAALHLIGTLQTRKARDVVGRVDLIESLDSLRLAAELDRRAAERGVSVSVLVEINSGREENKGGVLPEELGDFIAALGRYPRLELRGGMTMAPKCDEKSEYIKYFRETYQSIIDIWRKKSHNIIEPIISMGMSDSYEAAVECGATVVRVGTALFGSRKY